MRLEDQFEGDIRDPFNVPEQFAGRHCKDLSRTGWRVLMFYDSFIHFDPTGLRSPRFRCTGSPPIWSVTPQTIARYKTSNSVLPPCLLSILPGVTLDQLPAYPPQPNFYAENELERNERADRRKRRHRRGDKSCSRIGSP